MYQNRKRVDYYRSLLVVKFSTMSGEIFEGKGSISDPACHKHFPHDTGYSEKKLFQPQDSWVRRFTHFYPNTLDRPGSVSVQDTFEVRGPQSPHPQQSSVASLPAVLAIELSLDL